MTPPGACTSATSPAALPISARAIGELIETKPCFRSVQEVREFSACERVENVSPFEKNGGDILPLTRHPAPQIAAGPLEQPRIALIQGTGAVERIRRELEPAWADRVHFMVSISGQGKPILTLTAMGAHKGKALAVACADLGIGVEEVVAFGDSGNDLEMFKVAGASVAMGQADEELKSAATFVSARHDEDGVAVGIERLLELGGLS